MENIKLISLSAQCSFCKEMVGHLRLLDVNICPQCDHEIRLSEQHKERKWREYLRKFGQRKPMDIPLLKKESEREIYACQAVAALMALGYYGLHPDRSEFYLKCEAAGNGNHVLPWGVLKGVASYGLYVCLVSDNPFVMNDYRDVMDKHQISHEEAEEKVNRLIQECKENEKIQLFRSAEVMVLIRKFIEKKAAVLIPTLEWTEEENHSVVITNIWDGNVFFNDPNSGTNMKMNCKDFFTYWRNIRTDSDLIIISDKEVDFDEVAREY